MAGDELTDARRSEPDNGPDERPRAEYVQEHGLSSRAAEVDRYRRLHSALDVAPSMERVHAKYGHLREQKRREAVEAQGRIEVADLPLDSRPDTPELSGK
ncbi:hypothetical protein GR927_28405 [Mycolicibacterium sp. 3033]|nr:hypothetical protein [Mycolicibacterium aurantiacum]